MRSLVVNADDFGFTRDVNEGIIEAHQRGILTATTLMANGPAFDHAVTAAKENPELDVGCHLVLVQGNSVCDPSRALPATVGELVKTMALRRIDVYAELRAQVEKILAAGIRPRHLDTHKHTHLLPPVLDAVARLGEEFGIRWVRRPFDLPMTAPPVGTPLSKKLLTRGTALLRARFHRVLSERGCCTTDHFAGFLMTGRFTTKDLVPLLENLPDGLTEFMTHPGRLGEELEKATTRLKISRERELAALVAPETRRALERAGVRLVRYRDLT